MFQTSVWCFLSEKSKPARDLRAELLHLIDEDFGGRGAVRWDRRNIDVAQERIANYDRQDPRQRGQEAYNCLRILAGKRKRSRPRRRMRTKACSADQR